LRRRGGPSTAPVRDSRSREVFDQGCEVARLDCLVQTLLEHILGLLPSLEVACLTCASQKMHGSALEALPRLRESRRCRPRWTLQTVHAKEVAIFADSMADIDDFGRWVQGPNTSKPHNTATREHIDEDGVWTWLRGGTDWLGFQGLYTQFSNEGCKPNWVSFRLCLETLHVSSSFFALSADRRTWGLQPLIFLFNYRGDDMTT
ncbi:unnamed protein product, partial [Polarella glacialis]